MRKCVAVEEILGPKAAKVQTKRGRTERDGGGGRRRTDNIGGTDIIRPGETPPEIEERFS